MATRHLERSIETLAIERVLEHLHRARRAGRHVFPLTELAEATALDPETATAVMSVLEDRGPYRVDRFRAGEIRWRVAGSPYAVDDWDPRAWNRPE